MHQQTCAMLCLANFDWGGWPSQELVEFVLEHVVGIVEGDGKFTLRAAAIAASCRTVVPPGGRLKRGIVAKLLSEAIERLVAVAVADADHRIRLRILQHLDERFDGLLCQAEHLHALFVAFSDEVLEVLC